MVEGYSLLLATPSIKIASFFFSKFSNYNNFWTWSFLKGYELVGFVTLLGSELKMTDIAVMPEYYVLFT